MPNPQQMQAFFADVHASTNRAQVDRMIELLEQESDRGCILVGTAVIDRSLEELVRLRMVDDEKVADELLGRGRALDSFGARIQLARCFALLHADDCNDLDILRRIRNHAAHHAEEVSFADQKIIDLTNNLSSAPRFAGDSPRKRWSMLAGGIHYNLAMWISMLGKIDRLTFDNAFSRGLNGGAVQAIAQNLGKST